MMTRREAIKTASLATAACATILPAMSAETTTTLAQVSGSTAPFTLPPLPYAFDALEPHIDAQTMQIHHDKHHQAYVTNLNKALAGQADWAKKTLWELIGHPGMLPESIRAAVMNNGGGHYNHSLFWRMMKKDGGGEPKGELAAAVEKQFKSFSGFKDEFTKAALGRFGSGWAWLVLNPGKQVSIVSTPNQNSTVMAFTEDETRAIPLLGIDVWEHAYYLKYQNRRADYIAAFFNVIDWDFVDERFRKATA